MKNPYLYRAERALKLCLIVSATAVLVLASPERGPVNSGVEQQQRVREFIEAFNARNIDGMLELTDENIQLLVCLTGALISLDFVVDPDTIR
jgi:hypothetical protein